MMRKLLMVLAVLLILFGGGVLVYTFVLPPESAEVTSPLQPTSTPVPRTPTKPPLLERETQQIQSLVEQFYTAYADCMRNPPTAARGRAAVHCQANTGVTTDAFVDNLRQAGTARAGGDPISCAQALPTVVASDTVDFESPDRAVAIATAQYGSGFAQKISVLVVKESAVWKVDTVTCPRP